MAKGADYNRMIHSARWLRLRRDKLTACPLCERCRERGLTTAATEVHHLRPVEDGLSAADREVLMFSPGNLQSLCHRCHVEAHVEMGRSGKVQTARKNAERLRRFAEKFLN